MKRQEILYETDLDSRLEIESSLGSQDLAILLSSMPEDEATDIIRELELDKQKNILSQMEVKDAFIIKDLITYTVTNDIAGIAIYLLTTSYIYSAI